MIAESGEVRMVGLHARGLLGSDDADVRVMSPMP
jgi:hypothetical protein